MLKIASRSPDNFAQMCYPLDDINRYIFMNGGEGMDEAKIIAEIQSGQADKLGPLIEAHYGKIFAYCYRHTGDKELAQDLTQDTFLKMLDHIHKYEHYGKFQNYLYVIAGNVCKDYFKKKKPLYADTLTEDMVSESNLEEILAVQAAIGGLPFPERNAILLQYYHGCSIHEIATITNSTVPVTKYRLRRAKIKLQKILGGS